MHGEWRKPSRAMPQFQQMSRRPSDAHSSQKFASAHAFLHDQLASPPIRPIPTANSSTANPTNFAAQRCWPSGRPSPSEGARFGSSSANRRRVAIRLTPPYNWRSNCRARSFVRRTSTMPGATIFAAPCISRWLRRCDGCLPARQQIQFAA